MKKYIFLDLQTGRFSAHTTLEGLAEMCFDDLCRIEPKLSKDYEGRDPEKDKELIELYEYKLLEPTSELIEEYEKYFDGKF